MLTVRVPIMSNYEQRKEYPISLIKFLLDYHGKPYEIKFSDYGVTTQARDVHRIVHNEEIDIGWYGTSEELEEKLHPIRFPIWRGLLGYRVFIINEESQDEFKSIRSLEDLQAYTGAQGIGWTDTGILKSSGLHQETVKYDNIFRMVSENRIDYFSRGISEAFREVNAREDVFEDLVVERYVLLRYPFAGFLFTNKENTRLSGILEQSFRDSYADGEFQKFFYNHPVIKDMLAKLDLKQRTLIDIPNPTLTPETAGIDQSYWHQLDECCTAACSHNRLHEPYVISLNEKNGQEQADVQSSVQ